MYFVKLHAMLVSFCIAKCIIVKSHIREIYKY